jgi:hypothetical protein
VGGGHRRGSGPTWITPVKGSATAARVDESVSADPADGGSTFRWDATSQQYVFDWGSPKSGAGSYRRVGVMLAGGQTRSVNIGLR